MSSDVIKDNLTFIIDSVIKTLLPYHTEMNVHVEFYKGAKNIDSIECCHDFNYYFDNGNLGELPPMHTYDRLEVYTFFLEGQAVFHSFLDDIADADECIVQNQFARAFILDYNFNHGLVLKRMILNDELPKDISCTPEAQHLLHLETPDMMTSSIDLFKEIRILENAIQDNYPDHFEKYLESLDMKGSTGIGVDIEHTGLGQTKVSLWYEATENDMHFPLLEMPTEQFLDHNTFVEGVTSAFNEYMKPYMSLQMHKQVDQVSRPMA